MGRVLLSPKSSAAVVPPVIAQYQQSGSITGTETAGTIIVFSTPLAGTPTNVSFTDYNGEGIDLVATEATYSATGFTLFAQTDNPTSVIGYTATYTAP